MGQRKKKTNKNRTVRRVAAILKSFSRQSPDVGITELANRLGMAKSVVHGIVTTLVEEGLIAKIDKESRYIPGGEIFRIAHVMTDQLKLQRFALPVMEELFRLTGEAVVLVGWVGKDVRCLEKIEGDAAVRLAVNVGDRFPLHAGSGGKLMLAFLPEDERDEIVKTISFTPFTRHTITDPDTLREQLADIREKGYVVCARERSEDVASIGAPVRDSSGRVIGGIIIGGVITHFTPENIERFIPMVVGAAKKISAKLGFVDNDNKE